MRYQRRQRKFKATKDFMYLHHVVDFSDECCVIKDELGILANPALFDVLFQDASVFYVVAETGPSPKRWLF